MLYLQNKIIILIIFNNKTYLVGIHRYSYRSGIPAEIVGVEVVKPDANLEPRLCYRIRWSDLYEDWVDECTEHMTRPNMPSGYWTKEKCLEIAKKYKRKSDWRNDSQYSYNIARINGWLDYCCQHMAKPYSKLI